MSAMASQIISLTIVYSIVYSRRRSKNTSELRVTGLCVGNSPVTGEFPAQMASNAENISIWWRHHELTVVAGEAQMSNGIPLFYVYTITMHNPIAGLINIF